MSTKQIVDILDAYNHFTNADKQTLVTLFNQGNLTQANLSSSGGGGRTVYTGNIQIDLAEGVTLYNSYGSPSIKLDPNGDAFFGSNLDYPAKTAMAVFSTAQKYNGEDMGEGDLMLGDNSSGKANLLWDQSTGQLNLRTGTTSGIILDTDGLLKSGNYSPDASGWQISPDGNAEFNNIKARGSIQTAVFEYKSLSAYSGGLAVAKSAGVLADNETTGLTWTVKVRDSDSGQALFELNDYFRIKYWNGSELIDIWGQVASTPSSSGGVSTFTASTQSGGYPKTLQEGTTIVNYGISGQGIIYIEAGDPADTTTSHRGRLRMSTHAGAPWTTETHNVILGDLYNQYGTSTNHRFGIGIGSYGTGNYLSYNAAVANQFILKSGGGYTSIDEDGITLNTQTAYDIKSAVNWETGGALRGYLTFYDNSATYGQLHSLANSSGRAEMQVAALSNATYEGKVTLRADSGTIAVSLLEMVADSNLTPFSAYAKFSSGSAVLVQDSGLSLGDGLPPRKVPEANLMLSTDGTYGYGFVSSEKWGLHLASNATYEYSGEGWRAHVAGKSAYFRIDANGTSGKIFAGFYDATSRSAGDSLSFSEIFSWNSSGTLSQPGGIKISSIGSFVGTGAGMELSYQSGTAYVMGYDRDASGYRPLQLRGSDIKLAEGTSVLLTVDGSDVYTTGWTNWSSTCTVGGFSSTTTKEFYYRRIGKLVSCTFRIIGTSNSTAKTVSLPFTSASGPYHFYLFHAKNAGTWGNGSPGQINPSTSTLTCYWYIPNGGWTASGDCEIRGTFTYAAA